jgi:hypothetical protein
VVVLVGVGLFSGVRVISQFLSISILGLLLIILFL